MLTYFSRKVFEHKIKLNIQQNLTELILGNNDKDIIYSVGHQLLLLTLEVYKLQCVLILLTNITVILNYC